MFVHPGMIGLLTSVVGVFGFIRVAFVRALSGCGWDHQRSLVHSRAPYGSLDSSEVVVFTRSSPGGRCDFPGSLGSLACVVFIRDHCVHSRAPSG